MSLFRLLFAFLISLSPALASENILHQAVEQFQKTTSYSVTMHSYGEAKHVINYRYKKPGYVRMDFIEPHKGAVLVYRPDTGKVQLRPFGSIKALTLTMEPTSKLVLSPSGHRADESDIGVLLKNAQQLHQQGSLKVLREETVKKAAMIVLEITGEENLLVNGVHRYLIWMDKKLKLPRIVESYDNENQLIEGLSLEDMELDIEFADIFNL